MISKLTFFTSSIFQNLELQYIISCKTLENKVLVVYMYKFIKNQNQYNGIFTKIINIQFQVIQSLKVESKSENLPYSFKNTIKNQLLHKVVLWLFVKKYYNMETEKQTIYFTNNKYQHKQHVNSFHIFEPDYFINSAFTLTDSEQRHTSKILEQPFNLTPIQPSHTLVQELKEKVKGKSMIKNEIYDSSVKIKKTTTPSIENIVIQYQKNQNQSIPFKGLGLNKMQDIFSNRPQFSSIQIKTTRLAKEIGLHLRKPSSLQSQGFEEVCCESNQQQSEKKSSTSIKYTQHPRQPVKVLAAKQDSRLSPQSKQILNQLQEIKKVNTQLEKISGFLKDYTKNKREISAKESKNPIDWSTIKVMIEKELKCSASS